MHVVLAVAALEIALDRIAVPLLRPKAGTPPGWHKALDYAGLFLHYFVATLALAVIFAQCSRALVHRRPSSGTSKGRGWSVTLAHTALGIAALLAALPLVIAPSSTHALLLELAFAAAVGSVALSGVGRGRDLGVQIGLFALAAPMWLHTAKAVGAAMPWTDGILSEFIAVATRGGEVALTVVALISPYVFAPRPLTRAMTRPLPVAVAVAVAVVGVLAVHRWYAGVAQAAMLAIGFQLRTDRSDPRLALYLLALATLAWTLASCAIASAPARRRIGYGIALIALGGYAFRWPQNYLLPLLGLMVVAQACGHVRAEELGGMPVKTITPPIADAAWASYLTALKHPLAALIGGADVHLLTTRGDDEIQSSIAIADSAEMPIRIQIDRLAGAVISIDIAIGRQFDNPGSAGVRSTPEPGVRRRIDERAGAALTVSAIRPRLLGAPPEEPRATPKFVTGDAEFDQAFRCGGSAAAFQRMFDAELRARAATTLDGWLAYSEGGGLRYRVYPGHGAPLDHPLPLSDLALGRPATPERLVAVVALLRDIATRATGATAGQVA